MERQRFRLHPSLDQCLHNTIEMIKPREFINNILRSDTAESSKRFVSLLAMALVYYAVIRYTDHNNIILVLGTLCGFILTLLGVAAWEGVHKAKIKNKDDET